MNEDNFYSNKKNRLFDCHYYEHEEKFKEFWAIIDYNFSPGRQETLQSVAELMDFS